MKALAITIVLGLTSISSVSMGCNRALQKQSNLLLSSPSPVQMASTRSTPVYSEDTVKAAGKR